MNNKDIKQARAALRKYFSIYIRAPHWIIECDTCGARWHLNNACREIKIGNTLHLLNHAYGHHERSEP